MIGLVAVTLSGCKSNHTISELTDIESSAREDIAGKDESMRDATASSIEADSTCSVDWSDITGNGLDEESFLRKLDTEVLQDIAEKLQSLVAEELAEEEENTEIILSEGFTRVFQKERYLEVIAMGDKAQMPLYYILYKSLNNEMYEHICAVALSELTGLDFMNESGEYYDWASGKEYLELFEAYMINTKGMKQGCDEY